MARPLIVSALLAKPDFAWLDAQRRAHFPVERNQLPAHLTIFHALPPMVEDELRDLLRSLAASEPPHARIANLMNLGRGVAYRIESEGLLEIRDAIAARFHGMMTAQDAGGWRPHVTIQNKVEPKVAKALLERLEKDFRPRPLGIHGLTLSAYDGGPWERLADYRFR